MQGLWGRYGAVLRVRLLQARPMGLLAFAHAERERAKG